ncbi:MAG TPA: hypothetical protein VFO34_11045 [Candidatus Acidoferrales bacterium]|nr:hypothetical protein [Candidatus Acidoferrales bacterium]
MRIDGVLAAQEQSIFAGETVATDTKGAALARFGGMEIIIAGDSEVSFARDGRTANLLRGSFSARSFDSASAMRLDFRQGRLSLTSPKSSLLVGIRAEGIVWIECHAGTAELFLAGRSPNAILLQTGDKLVIDKEGSVEKNPQDAKPAASDHADPPATANPKKRHVPVWVYSAAVGGAVGAAVAVLARSKTSASCSTMSPSSPTCQ